MNAHIRSRPALASHAARVLSGWVDPLTARVRGEEIAALAGRADFDPEDAVRAARSLVAAARAALVERGRVTQRADTLRHLATSAAPEAVSSVLARHLRATVPEGRRRRGDLAALRRHLDLDALLEREAGEIEARGARVEVVARALEGLAPALAGESWPSTGAEALLVDIVTDERRPPTRRAAIATLARVTAARLRDREPIAPHALLRLRAILRARQGDPWDRRAVLDVVSGLEGAVARAWLSERLGENDGRESFLVRARAVELVVASLEPWAAEEAARALDDDSELVRACLADALYERLHLRPDDSAHALLTCLATDPEPRIRARVADISGRLGGEALPLLAVAFSDIPAVAEFAADAAREAASRGEAFPEALQAALVAAAAGPVTSVARRALLALHTARVADSPYAEVARSLAALRPGESRRVRCADPSDVITLAEALVPHAADGFGYSLAPGRGRWRGHARVTRGEPQRPTLWRLLHELRNPGPAKRQGHSHTLGRQDLGSVRVPPGGLAEESATGVPGQRVRVEAEDGWGPALPTVDDYLHATDHESVRIVTAEGITTVRAPEGVISRIVAQIRINLGYGRLDALRSSALHEREPTLKHRYVDELRAAGFDTEHEGPTGPSTPYFAGSVGPLTYLVSMGAATLTHLAVVCTLMLALLFGRAAWQTRRIRQARARIPLVVGGWGTRGKSGTERLKAGLFEGLGVPYLSKTTGCEAMVLHAPPGGHAVELFLFRPFDKATIWEQIDVAVLGARLRARCLLWECMGLNPIYVDLLQSGWMRDDLATLTNAYPDHEDIQGPTGLDVAEALGSFAPPDALLITTERNMLPVIEEAARTRGSATWAVSRVDAELVPRDLLDRMPHAEHPGNVALTAAVAASIGVPRVEAIGWMAEHVVPDLGALVVCPPAPHLGRTVRFANGMSANDTLAFRHNWRRTGFAHHDTADAGRWLVTVVNNRADRVARSRVFAGILANEADAHRHVLIGTNLVGLASYFEQAVEQRLGQHVFDGDPVRTEALFAHLRIVDPAALGEVCGARLGVDPRLRAAWTAGVRGALVPTSGWDAARAAAERLRGLAAPMGAYADADGLPDALVDALARHLAARAARATPAIARAVYRDLARCSLLPVPDSHASGDRIIEAAVRAAPPGADVWIMGVQNIKGTGLDFAYQWVWWRELHAHLVALADEEPARRATALAAVEVAPFGTVLACDAVIAALAPLVEDSRLGRRVSLLLTRVHARRDALLLARTQMDTPRRRGRMLIAPLERLLDPFDAIDRARRARQVFRDLVDGRISHPRAQAELRRLTERQKGGWLAR